MSFQVLLQNAGTTNNSFCFLKLRFKSQTRWNIFCGWRLFCLNYFPREINFSTTIHNCETTIFIFILLFIGLVSFLWNIWYFIKNVHPSSSIFYTFCNCLYLTKNVISHIFALSKKHETFLSFILILCIIDMILSYSLYLQGIQTMFKVLCKMQIMSDRKFMDKAFMRQKR